MAPVIVSKRGFLALVLWVLKGMNGCRVIIRIETGHSNLVSCFGPRIRALARYFTSAFASVKYLSQRPHPWAKTWQKIWMTGLNPTNNMGSNLTYLHLIYVFVYIELMLWNIVQGVWKWNKNMQLCGNCLCFRKCKVLFDCKTDIKLGLSYLIYDCAMECYNGLSMWYTSYAWHIYGI